MCLFACIFVYTFLSVNGGAQASDLLTPASEKQPVYLVADQLSHDDINQKITATGHVEIVQGAKILRANKIKYDLTTGTVIAEGSVSLLDESGDVHFSEYVELKNEMKDGYVRELLSVLADGSRFTAETAETAERTNERRITMTNASYTPCKVCEETPEKPPLWQIKASNVVHDAEQGDVLYKNARLEFLGVPVAYSPIFKHADASVKRKSGFLRPGAGWTTELGTYVRGGYYWDIAPDKDMTFRVKPTTRQGVLTETEWRQRFSNARININGSIAFNSERTEEDGRIEDGLIRGHIFADGLLDLNEKWRAGFAIERSSDKEYLRLYDLSSKNILESEIYAERFSGRNYSRISAQTFQDVRLGDRGIQPDVTPYMEHYMLGAPKALFGGRWSLDGTILNLHRTDDEQKMMRASLDAGWERRLTTSFGLATTIEAHMRADAYNVDDRSIATLANGLDANAKTMRAFPQAQITSSYPLIKSFKKAQAIIEPVAAFTIAPHLNDDDGSIPNEDSQDVQLDITNLFNMNRFPGQDRQEDGARVTYGLKTGLYGHNGYMGRMFIGQSYRFEDDTLFPTGSGLEDDESDIVGQFDIRLDSYLDFNYRVQLDHDGFKSRRHELQVSAGTEKFRMSSQYLYANAVEGTGFTEAREQIRVGFSSQFTEYWKLNATSLTDLGEEPGLRKASLGVSYADECFTFSVIGVRNITNDFSGENETTIMMRIGLKHLGEISTPAILLETEKQE